MPTIKVLNAYKKGGIDMCDTFIELIQAQMVQRVEAIELGDLMNLLVVYKANTIDLEVNTINAIIDNTDNTVKH